MGLGTLLFGLFAAGSGISCAKDNYDMKKETSHYDNNGCLTYYDRKGREFKNNEPVVQRIQVINGARYTNTVGLESGRVYEDGYKKELDFQNKKDKEAIEYAKRHGMKAAFLYNPQFNTRVTTELSTGKVIACLWSDENPDATKRKYRKFYVKSNAKPYEYNYTEKGDMGIQISKEEYLALKCLGSHRKSPSDIEVAFKLMGINM